MEEERGREELQLAAAPAPMEKDILDSIKSLGQRTNDLELAQIARENERRLLGAQQSRNNLIRIVMIGGVVALGLVLGFKFFVKELPKTI